MSLLYLHIFGPPQVVHGTRPVNFSTRKELALLVYLAVEPGAHSRKQLTSLLWPDGDPVRGRAAFRITLSRLREALGEPASGSTSSHLLVEGDTLRLAPDDLSVDLHALDAACSLAHRLATQRSDSREERFAHLEELEQARQLIRGSFLQDITVREAHSYEEWIRSQRAYWQVRLRLLFEQVAVLQEDMGALPSAIETTSRWLDLDPLHEEVSLRLMRLYERAGQRNEALRVYEACRALLQSELDAVPSAQLTAFAQRLRHAIPPARPAHLTHPAASLPPALTLLHTPLIGRDEEFARLLEAYSRLHSARGADRTQVVLVHGEAGIGKTRLAQEFVVWAKEQGAEVLAGRAFEMGGRLPYQPLIHALRPRLDAENAPEDLLADVWLSALARILPELRERYPDLPAPMEEEAMARSQLFEAVARLVRGWTTRRPVVLWLDDLQWADAASLDILIYLIGCWRDQCTPVLLLLSLRSEPGYQSPMLSEWRVSLHHSLSPAHLRLAPLSERQTQQVVEVLAAGTQPAVSERVGAWLYRETAGHPFYLHETLKLLLERRALLPFFAQGYGWALDFTGLLEREELQQGVLPMSVRGLIRARLSQLSPSAHAMLLAAAVLDQHRAFDHLAYVSGLAEGEALSGLDEALSQRFLLETPSAKAGQHEPAYVFTHDKLREVVYQEASEVRRRVFHRRAFERLQHAGASSADLAQHALCAALPELAFRWSVQAGDEAMAVFAPIDALLSYQRARQLLQDGVSVSGEEMERLFAHLSRCLEALGKWQEAQEVLHDLLGMAQGLHNHALMAEAHIRLSTLAIQTNDLLTAQTHLEDALALAREMGDEGVQAEVWWNLALFHGFYGDAPLGVFFGERAVAFAQKHERPVLLANSCAALAIALVLSGRLAASLATATQGHQIIQRVMQQGRLEPLVANAWAGTTLAPQTSYAAVDALCLNVIITSQINIGQTPTMRSLCELQLAAAYANKDAISIAHFATCLNHAYLDAAHYEQARKIIVDALQQTTLTQYLPLLYLWIKLGCTELFLGRWQEAEHAMQKADEIALQYFPRWRCVILPWQCALAAVRGEWERAEALALLAREVRRDVGTMLYPQDFARWYETEALLRSGYAELARADISEFARQVGESRRHRFVLLRMQAILAHYDGRPYEAMKRLDEAGLIAQEIGLPGELWQLQAARADLFETMGNKRQAYQAWQQAATLVRQLAERISDEELRSSFLASPPVCRVFLPVQHAPQMAEPR